MAGISDLLASFGPPTRAKLVLLGTSETLMDRVCSLNLEHVSPVRLKGPGISRRPTSVATEEAITLALMRRSFFARKPDAGFLITDFPATLLQAKVFDEWLEARNEALSGVHAVDSDESLVAEHYRSLGLMIEAGELVA